MQGALRAPFLMRAGLSRDQYVGTARVISTIVDIARLLIYAIGFAWLTQQRDYDALRDWRTLRVIIIACLAGFLGAYLALASSAGSPSTPSATSSQHSSSSQPSPSAQGFFERPRQANDVTFPVPRAPLPLD